METHVTAAELKCSYTQHGHVVVTVVPKFSAYMSHSLIDDSNEEGKRVKRPRLNGGLRERPRRKAYLSVKLGQNLLKEDVRAGPPLLEVMRPPCCSP